MKKKAKNIILCIAAITSTILTGLSILIAPVMPVFVSIPSLVTFLGINGYLLAVELPKEAKAKNEQKIEYTEYLKDTPILIDKQKDFSNEEVNKNIEKANFYNHIDKSKYYKDLER